MNELKDCWEKIRKFGSYLKTYFCSTAYSYSYLKYEWCTHYDDKTTRSNKQDENYNECTCESNKWICNSFTLITKRES